MTSLNTSKSQNKVPMRIFLLSFLLSLTTTILFAQEPEFNKDYQSLLWKIEHKDFKKPSYLYGTMHTSYKIAFHLNDHFFDALTEVDQIALETTPDTWLTHFLDEERDRLRQTPYWQNSNLYSAFVPFYQDLNDYRNVLAGFNEQVNGILYRNAYGAADFQEETYLDMFIYQAGTKQDKKVVALEDLEEARDAVIKSNMQNIYSYMDEHPSWLKKKLEEKGFAALLEDAYRDKDLDFIDTLNRTYFPPVHYEYMLTYRNENMVQALDSVLTHGNVFIAIGAAHLPGHEGVIEMLRRKGFKVTPLKGELTKDGKALKDDLETRIAPPEWRTVKTLDGLISLKVPGEFVEYENRGRNVGLAMDITNGAYVLMDRSPIFKGFNKEAISFEDIEGILYESIPGEILEKKRIDINGFPALDIRNKTKTGNDQRYLIIYTPAEIITLKMAGKKEYAGKFGDELVQSVSLRRNKDWERVSAFSGGYSVEMPGDYSVPVNHIYNWASFPVMMHSFDETGNYLSASYFHHDTKYLEEDEFELEYMIENFLKESDLEIGTIGIKDKPFRYGFGTSESKEGTPIFIQSVKKGHKYYLQAYTGKNKANALRFFHSFQAEDLPDYEEFRTQTDTLLYYTTNTPINLPYHFPMVNENEEFIPEEQLDFVSQLHTEYGDYMQIKHYKYHDYKQIGNADSLYQRVSRYWGKKGYNISQPEWEWNDSTSFYYTVGMDDCSRTIHHYYVFNHGVVYHLEFDSDETGPSKFQQKFVNEFIVGDTLIGQSPFGDKSELFFRNIESKDSLSRKTAWESLDEFNFKNKDAKKIIDIIENYSFKEKEEEFQLDLFRNLGKLDDESVNSYFTKKYEESEYDGSVQVSIITGLLRSRKPENYKLASDLMLSDPLLSNSGSFYSTFKPLRDSMELGQVFYPDLLEYRNIDEHYSWVTDYLLRLRKDSLVSVNEYDAYKNIFLRELKMEIKRLKTSEGKDYDDEPYSGKIIDLVGLLSPYYQEPKVKTVIDKALTLRRDEMKADILTELSFSQKSVDTEMIKTLAKDPESLLYILDGFTYSKRLDLLPKKFINQEKIAEALVLDHSSYPEIDSIKIHESKEITFNKDTYDIYIFRVKHNSSSSLTGGNKKKWKLQAVCFKQKEGKDYVRDYYLIGGSKLIDWNIKEDYDEFVEDFENRIKYYKRKRVKNN